MTEVIEMTQAEYNLLPHKKSETWCYVVSGYVVEFARKVAQEYADDLKYDKIIIVTKQERGTTFLTRDDTWMTGWIHGMKRKVRSPRLPPWKKR